MIDQISVSVIICSCNRYESLKQCVASIVKQKYLNYEIIIIDDHSDDDIFALLKIYQSNQIKIAIHRNEKNMGISYSRNKGASLASNDIIAFIDDDCISENDWLIELVKPFNNPRISIVGGLIKDPQPINISMVAARGHYKRFQKEGPCGSLPGGAANMAVRREYYINNPIRNIALEDWELCQNAIDNGYLVYNCPKAIVVHNHYHNLETLLRQRYRYGLGQTWFRKRYKPFPLNLQTTILVCAVSSLPLLYLWPFLMIIDIYIFSLLLVFIYLKDIRKGEKTALQAFVSFPVFFLLSLSEFYGRVSGLFKKPTQINFGTDYIKNIPEHHYPK